MFNQIAADTICALLEEGKSLRAACREVKVAPSTVLGWSKENKVFYEQYMRAREVGYKLLADELIDIADEKEVQARYQGEEVVLDLSPNAIARNRLRVDTRKWMLSKMLPKLYGDRLEIAGDEDNPLQTVTRVELVAMKGKNEKAAFKDVGN